MSQIRPVAIVTGASRGLGAAFALRLADEGWDLALCARRAGALHETVRIAETRGAGVLAEACDQRDAKAVEAFVDQTLRRFERIDLLVNNAGILGPRARLIEASEQGWLETWDVNLMGPLRFVRAVLPAMERQGGGLIVNLTSSVGRKARAGWGPYSISKFGIEGLTQLVHDEHGAKGIRCVALNPGGTATDMRAEAYPDEDPATLPSAERIAGALAMLVGDAARYPGGGGYDARTMLGI